MTQAFIFYFFALVAVISALMVITSRYPVRAVLFLVLTFFSSAVLWMLLEAEFLSLVLIFVYVGAVMTLFLFVVMMLNLDIAPRQKGWVQYLPVGILLMVAMGALMLRVINPHYFPVIAYPGVVHPANYSNVQELGGLLYTQYVYPFELAAVLLLVAIVAAISLAFRGRKTNTKAQKISEQLEVKPRDRVRLVE